MKKFIKKILSPVISPIISLIIKNDFNPSFIGVFTNPFWLSRKALSACIRRNSKFLTGKTLDFGCGTQPYRSIVSNIDYIAIEYDTPNNRKNKIADIYYDGNSIPLPDSSIDSIMSTQVLEHVPNPQKIVDEFYRILKPNGYIVLSAPLIWPEHETPYDFFRYTSYGIRNIFKSSGFKIIKIEKTLSDIRMPTQIFIAFIYDILNLNDRHIFIRSLICFFIFSPLSLFSTLLSKFTPKNEKNFLDFMIVGQKL